LQTEENFRNDEDDVSMESNATSTSNHFSRAWSGAQINLMNDNMHESMKNVITWDNGSTLSLFFNPDIVEDIKKYKSFRVTYKCWESKMQPKGLCAGTW
jgi:hypothetical protein